jgi:DNA-binding MarR family transcriptional regulator
MTSKSEDDSDDRSMRLLQPKLRILYYISKNGRVKNNLSELSRLLSYAKDTYVNKSVHELINDGYLKTTNDKDLEYLSLTRKGRRKIAPLVLTKFLPLIIVVIAFIPLTWALDEVMYGIYISPLVLLIATLLLLGIAFFMFYEINKLEKEYFSL